MSAKDGRRSCGPASATQSSGDNGAVELAEQNGKVFVVACVLDTIYQIWVLKSFYPGEMLVVAVACAIVPYCLVRGPILRGGRLLYRKWRGQPRSEKSG